MEIVAAPEETRLRDALWQMYRLGDFHGLGGGLTVMAATPDVRHDAEYWLLMAAGRLATAPDQIAPLLHKAGAAAVYLPLARAIVQLHRAIDGAVRVDAEVARNALAAADSALSEYMEGRNPSEPTKEEAVIYGLYYALTSALDPNAPRHLRRAAAAYARALGAEHSVFGLTFGPAGMDWAIALGRTASGVHKQRVVARVLDNEDLPVPDRVQLACAALAVAERRGDGAAAGKFRVRRDELLTRIRRLNPSFRD